MEDYKTWLTHQLAELGMTPTELAREFESLGINQPTVSRMASGATKNPSIGAINRVGEAIYLARKAKGLPVESFPTLQPVPVISQPAKHNGPALPLRVRNIINLIIDLRTNTHFLAAIEKTIALAQLQTGEIAAENAPRKAAGRVAGQKMVVKPGKQLSQRLTVTSKR